MKLLIRLMLAAAFWLAALPVYSEQGIPPYPEHLPSPANLKITGQLIWLDPGNELMEIQAGDVEWTAWLLEDAYVLDFLYHRWPDGAAREIVYHPVDGETQYFVSNPKGIWFYGKQSDDVYSVPFYNLWSSWIQMSKGMRLPSAPPQSTIAVEQDDSFTSITAHIETDEFRCAHTQVFNEGKFWESNHSINYLNKNPSRNRSDLSTFYHETLPWFPVHMEYRTLNKAGEWRVSGDWMLLEVEKLVTPPDVVQLVEELTEGLEEVDPPM